MPDTLVARADERRLRWAVGALVGAGVLWSALWVTIGFVTGEELSSDLVGLVGILAVVAGIWYHRTVIRTVTVDGQGISWSGRGWHRTVEWSEWTAVWLVESPAKQIMGRPAAPESFSVFRFPARTRGGDIVMVDLPQRSGLWDRSDADIVDAVRRSAGRRWQKKPT